MSISLKKKAFGPRVTLASHLSEHCGITERLMLERGCIRLSPDHELAVLDQCRVPLIPSELREAQNQRHSKDLFARIRLLDGERVNFVGWLINFSQLWGEHNE